MLPIYKKKVRREYLEKREANKLSLNLIHPTPDNLREECMNALKRVLLKKDELVLESFFKPENDEESLTWRIQRFDLDKFKPLVKYMRNETRDTENKNVALLAWLIDFEPRPYQLESHIDSDDDTADMMLQDVDSGKEINRNPIVIDERFEEKVQSEEGKKSEIPTILPGLIKRRKRFTKPVIYIFLGLIISCSVYFLENDKAERSTFTNFFKSTQERCMYWDEDHYEPISCNQKLKDVQILAIDTLKINQFKKITKPDTLTKKSLGTVWYSKIDNRVEFYTSAGYHPIRIERRLKPLTDYVLDKYVRLRQ